MRKVASSLLLAAFAATAGICNAFLLPQSFSTLPKSVPRQLSASLVDGSTSTKTLSAATKVNKDAILPLAQSFLLGSTLMYYYSELRQLSYCGYTKTKFELLDTNRWTDQAKESPQGITSYKLFQIIIEEGVAIVEKKGAGIEKKLLQSMLAILPQKSENKRGQQDLESLKSSLKISLDKLEKMEKSSGIGSPKDDVASDGGALENVVGGVAKFLKPKDEYPDTADSSLVALLDDFQKYIQQIRPEYLVELLKEYVEVIYFGDKYPQKECVYGIVVNHTDKRVTVVFRGSVNLNDWWSNSQVQQEDVPNPAHTTSTEESGSKQPKMIGLHKGFHAFLQRERRDRTNPDGTPATKFGRILTRAIEYTKKEQKAWGEDWKLAATGHSLGGALATLFGFYAATDSRLRSRKEPVEVVTFASPFVGDERFREAFKGLERNGELIHARFANDNDFVTMLPFISPKFNPNRIFNREEWDFAWYKHVGLEVFQKENGVKVSYPFKVDIVSEVFRTLQSNVLFSFPKIFQALDTHMPPEYQARLAAEIARLSKGTDDEKKNSLLTLTLKEYYEQSDNPIVNT